MKLYKLLLSVLILFTSCVNNAMEHPKEAHEEISGMLKEISKKRKALRTSSSNHMSHRAPVHIKYLAQLRKSIAFTTAKLPLIPSEECNLLGKFQNEYLDAQFGIAVVLSANDKNAKAVKALAKAIKMYDSWGKNNYSSPKFIKKIRTKSVSSNLTSEESKKRKAEAAFLESSVQKQPKSKKAKKVSNDEDSPIVAVESRDEHDNFIRETAKAMCSSANRLMQQQQGEKDKLSFLKLETQYLEMLIKMVNYCDQKLDQQKVPLQAKTKGLLQTYYIDGQVNLAKIYKKIDGERCKEILKAATDRVEKWEKSNDRFMANDIVKKLYTNYQKLLVDSLHSKKKKAVQQQGDVLIKQEPVVIDDEAVFHNDDEPQEPPRGQSKTLKEVNQKKVIPIKPSRALNDSAAPLQPLHSTNPQGLPQQIPMIIMSQQVMTRTNLLDPKVLAMRRAAVGSWVGLNPLHTPQSHAVPQQSSAPTAFQIEKANEIMAQLEKYEEKRATLQLQMTSARCDLPNYLKILSEIISYCDEKLNQSANVSLPNTIIKLLQNMYVTRQLMFVNTNTNVEENRRTMKAAKERIDTWKKNNFVEKETELFSARYVELMREARVPDIAQQQIPQFPQSQPNVKMGVSFLLNN